MTHLSNLDLTAGTGAEKVSTLGGNLFRRRTKIKIFGLTFELPNRLHALLNPRTKESRVVALLEQARAMIKDERNWVQGHYVMGDRHCAMGALKAAGNHYSRRVRLAANALLTTVARENGFSSVEQMNDTVTHDEVLARLFEPALTAAREAAH